MSWRSLFDDMAAVGHDEQLWERLSEVADRTRRERAARTLIDRLVADWSRVEVVVSSGRVLVGDVADVGADWFTLHGVDRREWLVPLPAVVQLTLHAGASPTSPPPGPQRRLGIGYALRALARGRVPVLLDDLLGRSLTGTIEAVGADAVDVTLHPIDEPVRAAGSGDRRVVAIQALSCIGGRPGPPATAPHPLPGRGGR